MEGDALMLCFRLGLIRASSESPNQKHTTTFLQKVTILAKAINRNKPSRPAAYCPPGSFSGMLSIPRALPPVTHGSALQAPERLWVLVM